MFKTKSLFQFKGVLYAGNLSTECFVNLQTLLDSITTVDNRRVVAVADELADTTRRHLGVLLSQIHRHLSYLHQITLAAFTRHLTLFDVEVTTHFLEDLVNSERMVVDLHRPLDNAFSQTHVHIRVVDNGIGHQRVDHALQIADATISRLCDILDDISRDLQTVATAFCIEDINTQLYVWFLKLSNQATGETCQQTVLHTLEIHGRTVGSQDNLASHTEKMIEDMEERVECLGGVHPLLNVVDDQHIDALVEVDEVVCRVMTHGVGELHLEQTGRDIENALLGIGLLATNTNGVDEVGLATTRGP